MFTFYIANMLASSMFELLYNPFLDIDEILLLVDPCPLPGEEKQSSSSSISNDESKQNQGEIVMCSDQIGKKCHLPKLLFETKPADFSIEHLLAPERMGYNETDFESLEGGKEKFYKDIIELWKIIENEAKELVASLDEKEQAINNVANEVTGLEAKVKELIKEKNKKLKKDYTRAYQQKKEEAEVYNPPEEIEITHRYTNRRILSQTLGGRRGRGGGSRRLAPHQVKHKDLAFRKGDTTDDTQNAVMWFPSPF